jgi:hypothetical protein
MQPDIRSSQTREPPVYIASGALVSPALPLIPALEVALDSGADGFELQGGQIALAVTPDEVKRLPELLRAFRAPPILHAAHPLFQNGQPQRDLISPTLLQARTFGCRLIVFPLGDVARADEDALAALRDTLARLGHDFPSLRIAAMNGAQAAEAELGRWSRFLEAASSWPVTIGMTFDLAGWVCSGGDLATAARSLGRYVEYVRVAAAAVQSGRCVAQPIRPSDASLPALQEIPPGTPRALTFATAAPDRAYLIERLSEYIQMVRSGQLAL